MSKHYNDYIQQDIIISLENQIDTPVTAYLRAKTYGNIVATKEFTVQVDLTQNEDDGKCHFSISERVPGQIVTAAPFDPSKS